MNCPRFRLLSAAAFATVIVGAAQSASAQVPFFGAGVGIFDPEIGVVQSGVVNDVQATVSADRKYVTMTMRAADAQLLALHEFTFQTGNGGIPGGFVGGAGGGGAAGNAGVNGAPNGPANGAAGGRAAMAGGRGRGASSAPRVQAAVRRDPSILDRPGMTRIGSAPASRARRD